MYCTLYTVRYVYRINIGKALTVHHILYSAYIV